MSGIGPPGSGTVAGFFQAALLIDVGTGSVGAEHLVGRDLVLGDRRNRKVLYSVRLGSRLTVR